MHADYGPSPDQLKLPRGINSIELQGVYARTESSEYDLFKNYIIRSSGSDYRVVVSFSDHDQPVRESYVLDGKPSVINGCDIMIGYNPGQSDDTSDPIESYFADFRFNDIFYNVETHGLTQDELIILIKSILEDN